MWQTALRGLPWPLLSRFVLITMRLYCASWRGDHAIPIRSGVFWHLRRSMTAAHDRPRIGGVGLQIVRDWVLWFNAEGPDGLVNGKAPGAPSLLNDHQRQALR